MPPLPLARLLACAWLLLAPGAGRLAADFAADLARVSVEAAGGPAAHEALHSFRAMGLTRVGDRETRFILHAARPDRLRVETLGERGSLVRAYDGVHAPWKKADPLAPPRRLGAEEELDFLLDADFDSPLFAPARRGISLDPAGEVVIDGRRAHRLLALLRRSELVTLYVDAETMLVTRRDRTKKLRGRELVLETRYSDFAETAGVLLPRRIHTTVAGRLLHDTVIESIDANPELPEDFFAPPVGDWPTR